MGVCFEHKIHVAAARTTREDDACWVCELENARIELLRALNLCVHERLNTVTPALCHQLQFIIDKYKRPEDEL